MTVAVLCGGVGAARFLRAMRAAAVVDPGDVVAIVNTADDTVLHGLAISPDLDTITYTLAEAIDPGRGWGLRDETWTAMESLARYEAVRPAGSGAAARWFNLGDRDLATHLYRTARLAEGAALSTVTSEIATAWGVPERLVPMSDDRVATRLTLADGTEVAFQEYFVRLRHAVPVTAVSFTGASEARLTDAAAEALDNAEIVVVAPSNPIVSIGPLRAVAGVDERLRARRDTVVAVSPIVGGAALKGPADRMLHELGGEATVVGVARMYCDIAASLVIDPVDAHLADDVVAAGMTPVIVPSVMSNPAVAAELARTTLAAARSRRV